MSETQTRTVTTSEVERMRLAKSARVPVDRWAGSGRWLVIDRCSECGHECHEGCVCTLCGASA